ncbi:hypothetical protein PFISCL1PPCAC_16274 [Pristionchus fissidentatus]|uniref:Uncharacterized protein n=1 Tax=Pristionchus fissidentatus TaxID=1538716 RepID=A0AAV5W1Y9_9BILA|nr:hypothetical protein PFISCL1PPCAC_16274 [Pristionchus fissidentatus]
MERREEPKKVEERHSMASRSSITSGMESLTVGEGQRKGNDDTQSNISSLRGSASSRPESTREMDRRPIDRESGPTSSRSSDVSRDSQNKSNVGCATANSAAREKVPEKSVPLRRYKGVVVGAREDEIFVASGELKRDAIIYQNPNKRFQPAEVLGKWIEFTIQPLPRDPVDKLRINNYSKIEPLFETRLLRNMPEIRVPLSFSGATEDGRPLLQSEMGFVDDVDGQISMDRASHGRYSAWIVRYFKNGHDACWRFSREDPRIVRMDQNRETEGRMAIGSGGGGGRRGEEQRVEDTVLDHNERELRDIMKSIILENDEIRQALIDSDRARFNEMFDILMED